MIQRMDTPLFPLHVVLFPGSAMPLHVFETRYRALMERVLSDDRRFGVLAIRRGREVGGYADTFRIGTMAVVEQVQRAPDGSMAIIVTGHERFAVDVRLPDDPYPVGEVTILDEQPGEHPSKELPGARAAVNGTSASSHAFTATTWSRRPCPTTSSVHRSRSRPR